MLYIYYAVLFVAIVLGLLFGMALYRWFHYRDIYEVGELLIGEEDSPDWPYLSLSLDEEVKNFEGDKYIMLRVHKLDQEVINDQEKAAKARRIEWAKFGISCLTFLGTIGTTVYWSICEAGGVAPLSRAMNDGLHEIKRGFTDRK